MMHHSWVSWAYWHFSWETHFALYWRTVVQLLFILFYLTSYYCFLPEIILVMLNKTLLSCCFQSIGKVHFTLEKLIKFNISRLEFFLSWLKLNCVHWWKLWLEAETTSYVCLIVPFSNSKMGLFRDAIICRAPWRTVSCHLLLSRSISLSSLICCNTCSLLSFPLKFRLFLKLSLIFHKYNLFHKNSLTIVLNVLKHFILFWKLSESFSVHVKSNICAIKIIFIFLIKLRFYVHCTDHNWV